MSTTLILGGPGSGKTTRLLSAIEAALARGIPPARLAFVAFTNAAADEARERACKRFNLEPKELPYFRTLHSLCFRELGLRRTDIVTEEHLRELGDLTGELFTGDSTTEGPAAGLNGDPLLTLDHYARATRTSLRRAWEDHGGQIEWYRLLRFTTAYHQYKRDRDLLDFTDLLDHYVSSDLRPIGLEEAVIDEAQDFTMLQWAVADRAFANVPHLWIGGDDDQAIHAWAGAAEEHFLDLPYEREILPLSHRLPSAIFDLSQGVVKRVGRRFAKPSRAGRVGGSVEWVGSPDEIDLSTGTWLLLARTKAQLAQLVELARSRGVVYRHKSEISVNPKHVTAIMAHEKLRAGGRVEGPDAAIALQAAGIRREISDEETYTAAELGYDASPIWHDALIRIPLGDREYYLACMRRGEKLTRTPRVRIETIHGAKGAEAENTLLMTDLTYRTQRGYELDPDSEARVFYVGLTRAAERLVLVAPQSAYGYPI